LNRKTGRREGFGVETKSSRLPAFLFSLSGFAHVDGKILLVAAIFSGPACQREALGPVGISTEHAAEPGAKAGDGGARASPVPIDYRRAMVRLTDPFPSRGHAERFDAVLWANASAAGSWKTGEAMADGAILLEEAIEHDQRGPRPAGLLVMEKANGAWRFSAVGTAGEVVDDARVSACADCHRDAPRDDVFDVSGEQRDH
jgi:hypothetical protein